MGSQIDRAVRDFAFQKTLVRFPLLRGANFLDRIFEVARGQFFGADGQLRPFLFNTLLLLSLLRLVAFVRFRLVHLLTCPERHQGDQERGERQPQP